MNTWFPAGHSVGWGLAIGSRLLGGGSLAPSYWTLTVMYTAVLYQILLPLSYSAPACGVKQRDQARTCEQNEPFLSPSQALVTVT